jgi:hypothetical protein
MFKVQLTNCLQSLNVKVSKSAMLYEEEELVQMSFLNFNRCTLPDLKVQHYISICKWIINDRFTVDVKWLMTHICGKHLNNCRYTNFRHAGSLPMKCNKLSK